MVNKFLGTCNLFAYKHFPQTLKMDIGLTLPPELTAFCVACREIVPGPREGKLSPLTNGLSTYLFNP